jgi:uncharacterized protein (DUF1330 family)
MAAYLIAAIVVTDMDQYKKYIDRTPGVIERYGGHFIARGGETVTLEGAEETRRIVLVEFPSLQQARAFYDSAEYKEVKKLREGAAMVHLVAIEGV